MEKDKHWKQVCALFKQQSSNAGEKFRSLLIRAAEGRVALLSKTVEFLNSEENEDINVFGTYTLLDSILQLILDQAEIGNDEAICDMLSFVIVEARHFHSAALVQTVSHCLEFIGANSDFSLPQRWIEVFGKAVTVLADRGEVEHSGDTVDGRQYKQEIICEICRVQWTPQNGASLIAALRELSSIEPNDVRTILDKAGKFVQGLLEDASSVPPIANQLLLFAGSTFPSLVIGYFNDYFSRAENENEEDNEDARVVAKRGALGATVSHFVQAARKSEPLLKELLRRIKAAQNCHSIIMSSPFMLSTAIGLISIDRIKNTVIDALKATILKWFTEIHQSKNNSWYFECTGALAEDSVKTCFAGLFEDRITTEPDSDFLLDGIRDLGVALLGMDQSGAKEVQRAKKQCSAIGEYLLVSLVSKKHSYLPYLINEFLKTQNSVTNIECLARCLKRVIYPKVRKEYVGILRELINHFPLMTVDTASPILKAILPSLQLSVELLGELVMSLRKTVWKSAEARRVSVTAMILLLCNSRILGDIPRSQFSNTQFFTMSQFSCTQANVLGSSKKNESVCYEVLGILRRFFTQQFEVRELLYIGIFNVARQNPELISFLCTHVENQMKKYFEASGDRQKLNITEMRQYASLQNPLPDPLGYFVQCLSFLLTKSRSIYADEGGAFSEDTPTSVIACSKRMEAWIAEIDQIMSPDFKKTLPKVKLGFDEKESRRSEFIVQVMQTVEALMEYLCLGGRAANQRALSTLFDKFNSLQSTLKAPEGGSKKRQKGTKSSKEKEKKGDDSTSLSLADPNDTGGGDFLIPKIPVKRATYKHVMATESLVEVFGKLYDTDEIDGFDPLRSMRDDKNFEKFLFNILKQKIGALKAGQPLKERDKEPGVLNGHLARIAGLLWTRTFDMSDEVEVLEDEENFEAFPGIEMDEMRLELAVEVLQCLFNLPGADRQLILKRFLNESDRTPFEELFSLFFDTFTQCIEKGRKYLAGNRPGKGIYDSFVILEIFATELGADKTEALSTALTWFTKFLADKSKIFVKESELLPSHAEAILSAFIVVAAKADSSPERFLSLAKRAHFHMSDVDGETQSFDTRDPNEKSWLVTPTTASTVLHQFALYAENTLQGMKDIIGRLSCPYVEEEKISVWREKCCGKMLFLMKLLTSLVRSKFSVGPWIDVVRKSTVSFFMTMTSITESFVSFHTKSNVGFRSKRFETLVKAIGADFKIRAEAMVHHIEEIRRKAAEKVETKKKGADSAKSCITKDTKTIPALIYSIEKYEQQLILLCEKTKINLLVGTRLSAPRDFRIIYSKRPAPPPVEEPPPSPPPVAEPPQRATSTAPRSSAVPSQASTVVSDSDATTLLVSGRGPTHVKKRPRLGMR